MNRLPNESAAIMALEALLNSLRDQYAKSGAVPEYTFDHLYQKAGFSSPEALSLVLAELVDRGEIQKRVRVESPSTGGIGDYESLQEVPKTVYDWRSDKQLTVTPENLQVIFKLQNV
jgi:hypothetical protein